MRKLNLASKKSQQLLGLAMAGAAWAGLAYQRGGKEHFWEAGWAVSKGLAACFVPVIVFIAIRVILVHKGVIDTEKERQDFEARQRKMQQPAARWALLLAFLGFLAPAVGWVLLFMEPIPETPHIWRGKELLYKEAAPFLGITLTALAITDGFAGRRWLRSRRAHLVHWALVATYPVIFWSFFVGTDELNVVHAMGVLMTSVALMHVPVLFLSQLEEPA